MQHSVASDLSTLFPQACLSQNLGLLWYTQYLLILIVDNEDTGQSGPLLHLPNRPFPLLSNLGKVFGYTCQLHPLFMLGFYGQSTHWGNVEHGQFT